MNYSEVFSKVVSHCKEHGFIFQSSEIYDGLSAVYDYGPAGVNMKKSLADLWWRSMTQVHEGVVGLDSAILMAPKVWKASGHVDAFNDPLIDNKDSKKRYRADVLLEDHVQKLEQKAQKEAEKKANKENWQIGGDEYNKFLSNSRTGAKALEAQNKVSTTLESGDMDAIKALIEEFEIVCPESGTKNWTDVRQFNLMFKTQMGSVAEDASDMYLRPETAQGIFVNFLNVQKTTRLKPPFGVAQIGKAFRNEIIARQFIFRMREFEQMEMQFFIKPGTQAEWFEHWRDFRYRWHILMGISENRLRFKPHDKLAHYADAATDIEFEYPFGFKEIEGIHSRTDFDLRQHQEFSGKKQQFFDPETNESYIPYVVETSTGLDRCFLMHLCNAYQEEDAPTASGGVETRVVLKLNPFIAPTTVAVLPLVKKDGLPEISKDIINDLKFEFKTSYEEKDAIGRRYRRQDAKGTPFCVTVDEETKSEGTVTIRERDSMQQERIPIALVTERLRKKMDIAKFFEGLKY